MSRKTRPEPFDKTQGKLGRRIVVVDDDEGILDAMQLMLESVGYEVETSADGEILENLDKNNLPDAILLDVLLSGKDGRQICSLLKKKDEIKHIPIIMVSAHPDVEHSIKACGADAFITKPFKMKELLQKVEQYTSL